MVFPELKKKNSFDLYMRISMINGKEGEKKGDLSLLKTGRS